MESVIDIFLSVGNGSGYGYGYGNGSGNGNGDGNGNGNGNGSGNGNGYGYGSGYGSGIKTFNRQKVYDIDGIQTIIESVRGNIAKGYILHSDFTLTPCYIVKQGDLFAHGETLKEAREALDGKLFEDMPEDERIEAFIKAHPDKEKSYSATDLFEWHNKLTGSCDIGRKSFCKDKGISIENDSFTVAEFIELTKNSYGIATIKNLKTKYYE